jgi:hypothetical protein
MSMLSIVSSGNFNHSELFLHKLLAGNGLRSILDKYGRLGVDALANATPKDSGKTASSWYYTIEQGADESTITWSNSNVNKGVNIAIILQYGHGTGTGGFVQGIDYINPAMAPIFDEIANRAWEEVSSI